MWSELPKPLVPNHVATLTVQKELPKYEHLGSLPYLYIKNETMATLHVATLTAQESYLNMRLYLASRISTLPLYQE